MSNVKCQTSNVKCPFVSTPERERSAPPSLGGDSHRPRRERGPYRGARRTKFHFVLLVPVTLTLRVICPAPQDIVPEKTNEYGDNVGVLFFRPAG